MKEERPDISELANEWKRLVESQEAAEARWREARSELQKAEQRFTQDQAQLQPVIELGPMGLAGLQHLLRHARERATQETMSLNQVEMEWTEVGMDEAKFQEMERAAEWIQSGSESDPDRSRNLRGLPLFRQSSYSRKELVVYGWLKTAYTNLARTRSQASEAQQALNALEGEVHTKLGDLVDDLNDETFEQLGQQLQNHLRLAGEIEQQKIFVARLESELYAIRPKYGQAEKALKEQLTELGIETGNLQTAVDTYIAQYEQNKQVEREEGKLERLQLQVQKLNRDIDHLKERQNALKDTETELQAVLTQADIECSIEELDAGLDEFDKGIENSKRWSEANSVYQGTLKHHTLSDDQARARLEASLAEWESRLATMRDEHPEWAELKADKTYIEYAMLSRQNDETWLAEREEHARLRHSIHQTIEEVRQLHTKLVEAQTRARTAQEFLEQLEAEISNQVGRFNR